MFRTVMRPAVLLAAFIFVSFTARTPAHAGELVLHAELTKALNEVLHVSESLHRALVVQDEEKTEIAVRDILQQLEVARRYSVLAKYHERGHLLRIIESAKEHFELTQSMYGEDRKSRMEDGFNQLVNLIRIYRLKSDFGIFFCAKDRSSWVQKGFRPQNPFRPETLRDCGIRAPR